MRRKAALVMTLLVFMSLISFSNRCKKQCDGRTMVMPVSVEANVSAVAHQVVTNSDALQIEEAGNSPLLRVVTL